jgi:hypothetical protein
MIVPAVVYSESFNLHFDGIGGYMGTGKAGGKLGYGANVGIDTPLNASLIFNYTYSKSITDRKSLLEREFRLVKYNGGLEYTLPGSVLPSLSRYGIFLRAAFLAGKSVTVGAYKNKKLSFVPGDGGLPFLPMALLAYGERSSGFDVAFKTGVLFSVTQHLSFFLDLGYGSATYAGNIRGFIVMGGLRLYMLKSRGITDL